MDRRRALSPDPCGPPPENPEAVIRVGWKHSPERNYPRRVGGRSLPSQGSRLERAARRAPTDGMTRIVSAEKSARWMAVLTWVLDRPYAGATECDEPEQQNASHQLAIDMMHPSGL